MAGGGLAHPLAAPSVCHSLAQAIPSVWSTVPSHSAQHLSSPFKAQVSVIYGSRLIGSLKPPIPETDGRVSVPSGHPADGRLSPK